VRVERMAEHPLYGKRIKRAKKYVAHDAENACGMGDEVRIRETRPLSKTKRWELVEIMRKAPVFGNEAEESEEVQE
ncbi:MAG: 30S ribosomal protein S17, partial [Synergistaceae bacterium]|nr:30S ribosomal protein S17 [Synergistaceae bacterium]